jgi:hypothetical protein
LGWTSRGSVGMPLHPDLVDVEDEHDGAEPDVCGEPNSSRCDRAAAQSKPAIWLALCTGYGGRWWLRGFKTSDTSALMNDEATK